MSGNGNKPTITRIEIRMNEDRADNILTFGEIMDFEEGKANGIAAVITKFMWDAEKGDYHDPVEALKFLRTLTKAQIKQLAEETQRALLDVAVPPKSEGVSESG